MSATPVFALQRGRVPLLVSVPHTGTAFPPEIAACATPRALEAEDTDWFLHRLYRFAHDELGASLLLPSYSRYVVDLNRPSENTPMYAGQNNTELCPTRHFTGETIHPDGPPDAAEIQRRVAAYWQPYHAALAGELQRLKAEHGHVALFDAHSIKSELPWLFEGMLPHLNLGTVSGASCAPSLRSAVMAVLARQQRYTHVTDGRFKGGHITRHYGRPESGVHAVQLEMCWRAYMREDAPYGWSDERAGAVRPLLEGLVRTMRDWKPA